MKKFFEILCTNNLIWQSSLITLLTLIYSLVFHCNIIGFIALILLFTVFDSVGFGITIHKFERYEDKTIVIPYRFMQNVFMYYIILSICYIYNYQTAIAFTIAWWFGVCDVLYYIILKEKMWNINPHTGEYYIYYWMTGWSVHWLFQQLTPTYECRKVYFIGVAIFGFLLSIAVMLCLK